VQVEGVIAHYERHGGLAEDIGTLGVGSLDDFLTANVTVNGELVTSPMTLLETVLERNPWMQRTIKVGGLCKLRVGTVHAPPVASCPSLELRSN
jgi:hypothetical protein